MEGLRSASQRKLDKRAQHQTLRSLSVAPSSVDFWSNDYLGLAATASNETSSSISAEPSTAPAHAAGSTGSRLLSGNSALVERVENDIASFHGFEAGLLFGSGYDANLGLLSCIAGRTDSLLLDELAHASLIDGARLSPARRLHFRHNDLDDLAEKLRRAAEERPSGNSIVVVEGTYSMDGDHCPLQEMVDLCDRFDAGLIIDEAHSIGVVGDGGAGLVSSLGLQDRVAGCVYTFGKAVGYHGAIVVGGEWLRRYLINFCRPFIYSTAPPPASVLAIQTQHQRMVEADTQRLSLRRNIERFRRLASQHLKNDAVELLVSDSPIQGLIAGDIEHCAKIESDLAAAGITVKAILSPTVAVGSERIRICIHSYNTAEEVDLLVETMAAA